MKKVLMIGSTVTDVIIRVPHLPKTEEDINVPFQQLSLGGCAYNAASMLHYFKIPYDLFSPVGKGLYGDFVRAGLTDKKITAVIPPSTEANGCCYCFVEADGRRTFVSIRGAEYHFKKEWFDSLDVSEYDSAYICGIDLEEACNETMLQFLLQHPSLQVFFAPGPRLSHISSERMQAVFSLQPILHLNKDEACEYAGAQTVLEAAHFLYHQTHNSLIITDAGNGSYLYEAEKLTHISAFPAEQVDTIGAGDAHIGTVIACLKNGFYLFDAVRTANYISSAVVECPSAQLSYERFKDLAAHLPLK